jgi:hypothetical protein
MFRRKGRLKLMKKPPLTPRKITRRFTALAAAVIILCALLSLGACGKSSSPETLDDDTEPFISVDDVTITGTVGIPITEQTIKLTWNGFRTANTTLDNVEYWFKNLTEMGLHLVSQNPSLDGNNLVYALTVTVGGTPTISSNGTPIEVEVSTDTFDTDGNVLDEIIPLDPPYNAVFDIDATPPTITIENVTISGTVGKALDEQEIVLKTQYGSFKNIDNYTVTNAWFLNKPTGLRVVAATGDSSTLKIRLGGTPSKTFSEPIEMTIPQQYALNSDGDALFASVGVKQNPDAVFNITAASAPGSPIPSLSPEESPTPSTPPTDDITGDKASASTNAIVWIGILIVVTLASIGTMIYFIVQCKKLKEEKLVLCARYNSILRERGKND